MRLGIGSGCVLFCVVGMCLAQHSAFDEVHDDNEKDAWLAGVFTPAPLKPAPWQLDDDTTPTPPPISSGGVHVPGVGELHGLRGYKYIKNRPIDAYLGVRYAQVGSGLGRFQASTAAPYKPYINATRQSENCAQFPELQRLQQAEARGEDVDDCLTLNIYTPAGARELPVLVFVHGEMLFDGGAEEAQPDYVLEHDVVLVSVNYRLAPFGFLSALSDQLPGNVALSDLQLALEWVRSNIRYFGGASSQVTLIGQAGGATLAHALSLSPKSQHLFQQLILQSGTALNPYLIDERPLETLATFGRLARCPNAARNLSPLYECLGRLRTSQLVSAFEQLLNQNEPRGLSFLGGFKLVVGDRLGFLPEDPVALVASNSKNNLTKPMIVGAAKDASAFIVSRFYNQLKSIQSNNLSDYINVVLRHTAPPQQHKLWHDWAVREIFTPDQARSVNARSASQGLLELSNLILYRAPVVYSIRLSHKKSPAYLYTFDYRGEHHRFGHFDNPLPFGVDASLTDDSVYLFPYPVETSSLNAEDMSLARALVAMWVNFAQSGIPNPNANVWPRATSEYGPFLRFTNSKESILELDQHFGDGVNVPNLYAQYFNTTNITATTTTTTRRPYYSQPQPRWPSPQPVKPVTSFWEEQRRQQLLREQQERDLRLREQQERELRQREQQERERQQREGLQREEEEKKREQQQRQAMLQQEQQRRQQFEREQRQREQEEREQEAKRLQENNEQQEREQEQGEYERRQQQEREQQQLEQQRREQQEREQWQRPRPDDRDQQREQQLREQQERELQARAQEDREQEAREQRERDQQAREQLAREQQQGQEQPHPYGSEGEPNVDDYPTHEDYLQAYHAWVEKQSSRYNPESYASAEDEVIPETQTVPQPSSYAIRDYSHEPNYPRRFKLISRHQRNRNRFFN